jgi:hypothetical protein
MVINYDQIPPTVIFVSRMIVTDVNGNELFTVQTSPQLQREYYAPSSPQWCAYSGIDKIYIIEVTWPAERTDISSHDLSVFWNHPGGTPPRCSP